MKWILTITCMVIMVLTSLLFCTSPTPKMPDTAETLGEHLFFDTILSINKKFSCASCHKPGLSFADSVDFSPGAFGKKGRRNTPSAMNVSAQTHFFWDGRATTLEEQALMPIANPDEMALPIDSAIKRLQADENYVRLFKSIFNEAPSSKTLAIALAKFEKSMETPSPFDDWRINDNENALSASAKRGFTIFSNKGKCIKCHFGPDFNNVEFRNIGLFDGIKLNDSGRADFTHLASDVGKFKIGPLRNIALTAPYMHNGMFKTLRAVIDYYNDPDKVVPNPINRDTLLSQPLHLTEQEKTDLENFLKSLSGKRQVATNNI